MAVLAIALFYTTDLDASGINATEIAKYMMEKSPYFGSFDRWDYTNYCGGSGRWEMTSTEMIEIQCEIDELTRMYNGVDTYATCDCPPSDYYDGETGPDLLHRLC